MRASKNARSDESENSGSAPGSFTDGRLQAATRRNERNWRAALAENQGRARWLLLGALLARIDQDDPDLPFLEERIAYCREVAHRLRRQYGSRICASDPHIMHVASRLLGGDAIALTYWEMADETLG